MAITALVVSGDRICEPDLKWPLLQNVRYFDKRILTIDNPEPERFITSEKKNVLVDSYVKWRIFDPKLYYISVGGDEARARTARTRSSSTRSATDRAALNRLAKALSA